MSLNTSYSCWRFWSLFFFLILFSSGILNAENLKTITGKDGAEMVLVPGGGFVMGSPAGQGRDEEHPQHQVYVSDFYLDKYLITVDQYAKFCEATGREKPHYLWLPPFLSTLVVNLDTRLWSFLLTHDYLGNESNPIVRYLAVSMTGYLARILLEVRGTLPITGVSWDDANAYCRWVGGRLPTEAEYEKAVRGGTTTTYFWGNDSAKVDEYAWYIKNSNGFTYPVGDKKPNPYGLYDIVGDAWEWCSDYYGTYGKNPIKDPTGPAKSSGLYPSLKVLRGGATNVGLEELRSAFRHIHNPYHEGNPMGFRCARAF
jgi:formylglycine-generating enzyme required for sulfatase activity